MNSAITCRAASRDDLSHVLKLYAQPDVDNGNTLSIDQAQRIFDRIARYPDYKIHLAVSDGKVVGTFALLIMDNLGHLGAPSGVIEAVAVDPACQSMGIGKIMMEYAIGICRDKGCYKVALSSNLKRERAHAFYDSLSFKRHGYSFYVDLQKNN
jgi:GNAT superfamily N-acetyltransferase